MSDEGDIAQDTGPASAPSSGLTHDLVVPSASQDQLQNIATKKAAEYAKHAFDCTVEVPGDLTVVPRMTLVLNGTGTIFDQEYDIEDVTHKMSWDEGFTTTFTAKTAGGGGAASGGSTPPASG